MLCGKYPINLLDNCYNIPYNKSIEEVEQDTVCPPFIEGGDAYEEDEPIWDNLDYSHNGHTCSKHYHFCIRIHSNLNKRKKPFLLRSRTVLVK